MANAKKPLNKSRHALSNKKPAGFILIVEDEPAQATIIRHILQSSNPKVNIKITDSLDGFRKITGQAVPEIVLIDINLPDGKAFDVLVSPPENGLFPVVVMTAFGDEKFAVRAIKSGAIDYVVKSPEAIQNIPRILERALQEWRALQDRKIAELKLKESEARYHTLYENIVTGLYRTTPSGKILMANQALIKMLGYKSFDKLAERNLLKTGFLEMSKRKEFIKKIEDKGEITDYEASWIRCDGSVLLVRESARAVRDAIGKTIYYDGIVEDITEQKISLVAGRQAEDALRRVTRLYATLSQVNNTIVKVKERKELFESICRIAVKYGQFRLAWIGLLDEQNERINPICFDGFEDGYLKHISIRTNKNSIYGKKPSGKAFQRGEIIINENTISESRTDLWREEALKRGYLSSAAVPFNFNGKVFGILNLCSSEPGFFTKEELDLLKEIGMNVSYALESIKAEEEHKKNEELVRENEEIFKSFLEHSPIYVFFKDENIRAVRLSKNYEKMLGRPLVKLLGKNMDELFPSELAKSMVEDDKKILRKGKEIVIEEEFNGRQYSTIKFPINIAGKPRFLAGYTIDITEHKVAEKELSKTRNMLEQTFEQSPVPMVLVSMPDAVVRITNQACKEFLGVADEPSYIGTSLLKFKPSYIDYNANGEVGQVRDLPLARALAGQRTANEERRIVRKDGTTRWELVSAAPIYDANGEIIAAYLTMNDITARKKTEEALQKSEEKFRSIIETTDTGFVILDKDGKVIEANSEYIRLCGFKSFDEIYQRSVLEWTLKDEAERNAREIAACLKNGYVRNLVINYHWPDGKIVPVEINANVVKDGDNIRILTICRDITERIQAENRFKLIFEGSMVGIAVVGLDGKYLMVNPAFSRIFGYSAEELLKIDFLKITYPEDMDLSRIKMKEVLEGSGKGIQFVKRYIHKDGHIIWTEVNSVLVCDLSKKPVYFITHVSDISERKYAEEALRTSEEQFRKMFKLSASGMVMVSLDFHYLQANDAFCEMLGYTEDELRLKTFQEVTHPDDRGQSNQLMQRTLKGDLDKFQFEKRYIHKNGSEIWGLVSSTLIHDSTGRPLHFVTQIQNITERKRAEKALRESEERFSTIFKTSPIGMSITNPESGRVADINPALLNMLGYTRDEIIDHSTIELGIWVSVNDRVKMINEIYINGKIENFESTFRKKEGKLIEVIISAELAEITGKRCLLTAIQDITERKLEEKILQSRLRLIEYAASNPLDKLMQYAIDEICTLSESPIGFFHFVEPDGRTLSLQAWSTRTLNEMCTAEGKDRHYNIDDAGVWVDCVREFRPVIHNDYTELQNRKGMPEGHAPVKREMVFPIFRNRKIVSIIGVGNKPDDYTNEDVAHASRLADLAWDIVERKRAEEAILRTAHEWQVTFDSTNDAIWVLDENQIILRTNKIAEKMFQRPVDKIVGKYCWEVVHGTNKPIPDCPILVSQKSLKRESTELQLKGKWYEVIVDPIIDPEGGYHGAIHIVSDITERRTAEDALRESEVKFRSVIQTALEGVWFLDKDLVTIDINDAVIKMLGYNREEIIGRPFLDFVIEEDKESQLQEFERRKQGMGGSYERRIRCKDGSIKWLFLSANARYNSENKFIGTFAMITDITERKKMENALRESERNYRGLIDGMNETVWINDYNGSLIAVNKTAEKILGYTRDELISIGLNGIDPSMTRDNIKALALSLPADKTRIFETSHKTKDGRIFPVEIYASIITYQGKKSILSIARDISERRRIEEAVRQVQKLEGLGTLAGGVAHDFNNILGIILAYNSGIKRFKDDPKKLELATETITKAVERGKTIVQQILTFARKSETTFAALNVNDVVMEIMTMILETFPKILTYGQNFEKGLPSVTADHSQLYQALLNLCVNARDAMPTGGRLTINTHLVPGENLQEKHPDVLDIDYVCIEVIDTGQGMNDEVKKRIFEPFFTTKGIGKGTGLGLAVVFGVVQTHKGFIDVESEPGNGTIFRMYLPASQTAEQIAVEYKDETLEEIPGGKETILIVEDEEMLMMSLQMVLLEKGYNVLPARDGLEAMKVYQENKDEISLVMTDLGLPTITGLEVCQRIKKIKPDERLILATGYLDPEMKAEFLNAGIEHFLFKPYDIKNVLIVMRKTLDENKNTK